MSLEDLVLTEQQKEWFGDRMDENQSGRVLIPSHLYEKLRNLADDPSLPRYKIKAYLIRVCYS